MLDETKRTVPFSVDYDYALRQRFFRVKLSETVTIRVPDPIISGGREQYTKRQALKCIKDTIKGSEERGALIQFMVENKLVPNRTALYRLIRTYEDGMAIGSNKWGAKGQPKHEDHVERNSKQKTVTKRTFIDWDMDNSRKEELGYPRFKLQGKSGWRGSILLYVKHVRFCTDVNMSPAGGYCKQDICKYIGNLKDEDNHYARDQNVCKLYFRKDLCPPPNDNEMKDGGRNKTFAKLKHYIQMQSRETGSPVICCGGDNREKYRHKRFACKHKYWCSRERKEKRCPFSFQVRWDEHGYYIHLLNSPENFRPFGCTWHLCDGNAFFSHVVSKCSKIV